MWEVGPGWGWWLVLVEWLQVCVLQGECPAPRSSKLNSLGSLCGTLAVQARLDLLARHHYLTIHHWPAPVWGHRHHEGSD